MAASEMNLTGSLFGYSGTEFANQGTSILTLVCALSGLALIPVACDSYGRIGSVF